MPTWTEQQERAINTVGENILVNAAAGSGKTAVLVERVIKKISSPENRVDIDTLLVVTFTKAAAAEMRGRISEALTAAIRSNPADGNLKKQLMMLNYAEIITIDAFCINLVKNNFHILEIDPNFSIADDNEIEKMESEVIDEFFEELYQKDDAEFWNILHYYSEKRSDNALKLLIRKINKFTENLPDSEKWLINARDEYLIEGGFEKSIFAREILDIARVYIGEGVRKANELYDYIFKGEEIKSQYELMYGEYGEEQVLSEEAGKLRAELYRKFAEIAVEWKSVFEGLKNAENKGWDEIIRVVSENDIKKNSEKKFKSENIAYIKSIDADLRGIISKLREIMTEDVGSIEKKIKETLYPVIKKLVDMVLEFDIRLNERKNSRNLFGFADIERMCYRLLVDKDGKKTELAVQLEEKYSEILLDEYQDSNELQDAIFTSISNGRNMFMVGDMKQSIYKFRSSDAQLFKRKSDRYTLDMCGEGHKIILSKNFRSRAKILDVVNEVFENIMSEYVGEIEYNEEQRLNYGADYCFDRKDDTKAELIVLDTKSEKESGIKLGTDGIPMKAREIEARIIARKIKELKESGFMVTQKDSSKRAVEYRDFAILLRSPTTDGHIFSDALKAEGVEAYVEVGDYFEKNEVRLMLSLLKLIVNPRQDISLTAVLRSVIWDFSDDELAMVRMAGQGSMYSALNICCQADAPINEQLRKKCEKTVGDIKRWREYSKYMSSDKLVWTIYTETDYYAYVGALSGGEECQANLRMIYEKAKFYENSGFRGLFNFIELMERMMNSKKGISSAKLITENHNVVRLLSMHKSKGLEYPVVILAAADKSMTKSISRDSGSSLIMNKEMGFGMDYRNYKLKYTMPSITKIALQQRIKRESLSEEMRILYVAMTRAKEKLIVTAAVNDVVGKSAEWDIDLPVNKMNVLEKSSFLDWIMPSAKKSDMWDIKYISVDDFELPDIADDMDNVNSECGESELDVGKIFSYEYKYKALQKMQSKISVTELKRRESADDEQYANYFAENEIAVPSFLSGEKYSGAKRGTLTHLVMQEIEFAVGIDERYVDGQIEKIISEGKMSEEESRLVYKDKIVNFLNSDFAKRAVCAERFYREVPFEVEIPVSAVDKKLGSEYDGENVILQGIIDGYFVENGEIVLFDYKTDKYGDKNEIVQKYKNQIAYYKNALEKVTGKRVKESVLYLFYRNEFVVL